MFFTQEDYKKIQQWLIENSVKDTEFNEASLPLRGNEEITIIQGDHNKKMSLKDLANSINLLGASDFINVSESYNAKYITLQNAISLIPYRARKLGQVITFLNKEGNWNIYQFKGEALDTWNNTTLWVDIIESLYIDSILPDEEDLTVTTPDVHGNTKLKFKDKEYTPNNHSGLGRVYLRKNIVVTEDNSELNILTQTMLSKENTIYIIQYDFNLNGKSITIPKGCILDFQGGSLNNGNVIGNNTAIKAGLSRLFGENLDIKGNWNIENAFLEWFGVCPDTKTDCTKEFQKAINTFKNILISNGTYNVSKLEFLYDSEIKGSVGDCTIRTTEGIVVKTHNNFLMEGVNIYGEDNTECVVDVYDNFGAKFDRVSIGGGKIGMRFNASEHSYYNNISRSSISGSKIGILFTHNSNANTVLENRFYQCETCIVIDSCNGNRIMCNTFQDFTLCGIRLEYNNYGSITRANFIAANYFEANQTNNYSDIDFTSNSSCTNNTVIGNNFTYKTGNLHIANNAGENVILDSSGATYSEVLFQLLGGVLRLPTLSSGFTSTYAGDRYKSCLSYIQKGENNTALLSSLMDSEGQYWAEVLTKDRKGQIYLPSIQTQEITQYSGGKINLGENGSLSERALTFKSGYGIIQYGYSDKWHYLQPMSSGTTRPFVAPFGGYCHFDNNLNKPIWWNGSKWVDATGADV